jgi:hypothetical protein
MVIKFAGFSATRVDLLRDFNGLIRNTKTEAESSFIYTDFNRVSSAFGLSSYNRPKAFDNFVGLAFKIFPFPNCDAGHC